MFHRCRMKAGGERAGGSRERGTGRAGREMRNCGRGKTQPAAALEAKQRGSQTVRGRAQAIYLDAPTPTGPSQTTAART
jgi:hypothetical protein